MKNRNRFVLFLLACLMPLAMTAQSNHWTPQTSGYEDYMSLTGVIQINGVEQQGTTLEVGAFCGTECRASAKAVLFPVTGRYVVFLTIYGNIGDQLTFKLYDHSQGMERNLQSPAAVTIGTNGLGSVTDPYVLNFTEPNYTITVSASPSNGGTVSGAGIYQDGSTCTLTATANTGYTFNNWTENSTVVSTNANYTFTVTGNRNLVANFTPITFHFITAGTWNNASNWSGGALPGANDEIFIDATCQLNMNATVSALTVSDGQSLTLQSGQTLTVTHTLINTATTGLIIEDGAQLVHASENVSAMVKKNITGYGTNRGKYALISNPLASTVNPELASIYHLTRGNYDLYDWLPSTPDNLEWRNYKDSDFMMLPDGYGYLYANQNGVELNFPGTLKPSDNRFGKSVSYDSGDSEHPGWNLIGNPFMCNAYLVNGNNEPLPYYRMNAAGNAFEVVAPGTPIAPMEGIFYKASGNGVVYFIRAD